eukprot:2971480-Pleurochrysis_carterae.AAC.1
MAFELSASMGIPLPHRVASASFEIACIDLVLRISFLSSFFLPARRRHVFARLFSPSVRAPPRCVPRLRICILPRLRICILPRLRICILPRSFELRFTFLKTLMLRPRVLFFRLSPCLSAQFLACKVSPAS